MKWFACSAGLACIAVTVGCATEVPASSSGATSSANEASGGSVYAINLDDTDDRIRCYDDRSPFETAWLSIRNPSDHDITLSLNTISTFFEGPIAGYVPYSMDLSIVTYAVLSYDENAKSGPSIDELRQRYGTVTIPAKSAIDDFRISSLAQMSVDGSAALPVFYGWQTGNLATVFFFNPDPAVTLDIRVTKQTCESEDFLAPEHHRFMKGARFFHPPYDFERYQTSVYATNARCTPQSPSATSFESEIVQTFVKAGSIDAQSSPTYSASGYFVEGSQWMSVRTLYTSDGHFAPVEGSDEQLGVQDSFDILSAEPPPSGTGKNIDIAFSGFFFRPDDNVFPSWRVVDGCRSR